MGRELRIFRYINLISYPTLIFEGEGDRVEYYISSMFIFGTNHWRRGETPCFLLLFLLGMGRIGLLPGVSSSSSVGCLHSGFSLSLFEGMKEGMNQWREEYRDESLWEMINRMTTRNDLDTI